nr:MAG TPA: hypothetical protein [Caudoviricetes sp.]
MRANDRGKDLNALNDRPREYEQIIRQNIKQNAKQIKNIY